MKKGLFLSLMILVLLTLPLVALSAEKEALTNKDCIKCHPSIVQENEANGGKHKTKVTCTDCHVGHPPLVTKGVIPECSKCHKGKLHYTLSNCSSCHFNPHTPLVLKLEGDIVKPCLTCHDNIGKEMEKSPSAHSQEVACNSCHSKHGEIPLCSKCHEPHSPEMKNQDCLTCHPPHRPKDIVYGNVKIPNGYCGACHEDFVGKLNSTKTKHKDLDCIYCHKEKHGYLPTCQECHGTPHPQEMLKEFANCVACHVDAHGLVK